MGLKIDFKPILLQSIGSVHMKHTYYPDFIYYYNSIRYLKKYLIDSVKRSKIIIFSCIYLKKDGSKSDYNNWSYEWFSIDIDWSYE